MRAPWIAVALWLGLSVSSTESAWAQRAVLVSDAFYLGDQPLPAARGELGALTQERPAESGHPLPRVIIDVSGAKGGDKAEKIQAAARKALWGKVVSCYAKEAWRDPTLKIDQSLKIIAGGGSLKSAKLAGGAKKPGGKLGGDAESAEARARVGTCLAEVARGVAMPKGRKKTSATLRIRVFPGDDPLPPPASQITRGSGNLDLAKVKSVIAAAKPELEACYDEALAYAPTLWGDLAIRLRVDEKGKTSEAFEVSGPFVEERVTRCILRHARNLVFEAPTGGDVRVVVPLSLSP